MKEKFNLSVGYSDHSEGTLVPLIATALGAQIIEKHFTIDKNLAGPDHKASLNPTEFLEMIRSIRNTEKILGNYEKEPHSSELKNIETIRKSIVAKKDRD